MYTHSNFCTFVDFEDGGYTKQHENCSPEAINIKLSVSGVMLVLVSIRIPRCLFYEYYSLITFRLFMQAVFR